MEGLEEKRKLAEKGMIEIAGCFSNESTYICILKNENAVRNGKPQQFCHRYFLLGDEVVVSFDLAWADLRDCIKWYAGYLQAEIAKLKQRLAASAGHSYLYGEKEYTRT